MCAKLKAGGGRYTWQTIYNIKTIDNKLESFAFYSFIWSNDDTFGKGRTFVY